jgi:putative autotransporter adhesin-like protein
MYVLSRFLVASVLSFTSPEARVSTAQSESLPAPVVAQKVVPLTPFSSVELRSGGKAILHHGPTQRVTLVKGSLDYTHVTIGDGGRLVIDSCKSQCPREYDLEIEIVTPDATRISVADGGTIQSSGSFPRQAEITVAVNEGGSIDIRSMAVNSVTASVYSGGRIFTRPQAAMFASVVDGGIITYWGDARIRKSIKGGGVVTRGTAAEAGQPLSELSPPLPSVPPIPALPPIQPLSNLMR